MELREPALNGHEELTFDRVIEEITKRYRSGQCEPLDKLQAEFPDFASELEAIIPTLSMLEKAANLSASGASLLGTTLGDYRIDSVLGEGGMGIVYAARQISLERCVAIKLLHPQYNSTPEAQQRFIREATAAASLSHPNIVAVHQSGKLGDSQFYSMQRIDGCNLDQIIRRFASDRQQPPATDQSTGALNDSLADTQTAVDHPEVDRSPDIPPVGRPVEQVGDFRKQILSSDYTQIMKIGVQLADALQYAHDRNVIHRDIKPSNILLDTDGNPWITDFGLAKTSEFGLTKTGHALGTRRYMPPEQFHGQATNRSDIYSLGLTLYELLTLRPAFEADSEPELMRKIMQQPPMKPRSIEPKVPLPLEKVVLKAIEKDSRNRYATASDFRDDLQRALDGSSVFAQRGHRWKAVKKRLPWITMAGLVLLAATFLFTSSRPAVTTLSSDENDALPFVQGDPSIEQSRQIAQWALQNRGSVVVRDANQQSYALESDDPLPSEPFHLTEIYLSDCPAVTDQHLWEIAKLPYVHILIIPDTKTGNEGVKALADNSGLISLALGYTRVTDEGVQALPLGIEYLNLNGLDITDAAASRIRQMTQLKELVLHDTLVSDETLQAISSLRFLTHLDARGTAFTPEAVAEFRETHPGCYVRYEEPE